MNKRRRTDFIVIHCSATPPGSDIGADEIDLWHRQRGWDKIGYASVIRRDGEIEMGRHFDEIGIHVRGYNARSVGTCMVGGVDDDGKPVDNFTDEQYESLDAHIAFLQRAYPHAEVIGHRDLSPDLNGDGLITSDEWLKTCPCFDVRARYGGKA